MNKRFKVLLSIITLSISIAYANDNRDGLTSDGNYFYMANATVLQVGIRNGWIFTTITNVSPNNVPATHTFYIEKEDNNQIYATLLSAMSCLRAVKVFFFADDNSPDIVWGGETATHKLAGVDLQ